MPDMGKCIMDEAKDCLWLKDRATLFESLNGVREDVAFIRGRLSVSKGDSNGNGGSNSNGESRLKKHTPSMVIGGSSAAIVLAIVELVKTLLTQHSTVVVDNVTKFLK